MHKPWAWAAAGADLVLGGHIHLPFTLPLHGLAQRLWAVQAGTAVSARTRSGVPNSVSSLRWDAARRNTAHIQRQPLPCREDVA